MYPDESYPTDPYRNDTFYPIGKGGLTNQGKNRTYVLGQALRERYNDFLGDVYWPSDVKALTTDSSRTKMSMQMVLAALYPPRGQQVWKQGFDWQPIPSNYVLKKDDPYFIYWACPVYIAEFKRVRKTQRHQKELSQFTEFMKKLSNHTGREVKDTEFIYYLYHTLTAQSWMKLTLPDWTRPYYPKGSIIDATLLEYDVMSYNDKLKRLNGGMTLRKILDDLAIVTNKTASDKPKIHLYGAHECNIGGVLQTLNLWKREIPEYASSIVFEIYEENSKYYIQTLYYKGIIKEFEVRRIPGCGELCELDKFLSVTKNMIPVNVKEECFGPNHESYEFLEPVTRSG